MSKKPPARSRYDELHDRFHPILTGKAGTRYERLAAMVWKILDSKQVVVHDVKLIGDTEVAHQIDVSVVENGEPRRTVLECKDFDIRGAPVGLGILRDFRSVLEDTGADGMVVTCNDFTRDARKYAKAKGIKLLVLRTFEDEDMKGRIRDIVINFHIGGVSKIEVDGLSLPSDNLKMLQDQLVAAGCTEQIASDDPVDIVKAGERLQFNAWLQQEVRKASKSKPAGSYTEELPSHGWEIEVEGKAPIAFDAIKVTYQVTSDTETFTLSSTRVAELLLSGFGNADIIIYGDELERHQIDEDGEVI